MPRQSVGSFSQNITNKLDRLRPAHSENCIFRVHDRLRKENADAYEPTTIAIGPYHRGKQNLLPMEEHKLRYLQQFLQSRDEKKVDRYVEAMRDLEERARKCYGEYIKLDSDEFVEMMLLDGIFITHFLRKCCYRNIRDMDPNDPIFRHSATKVSILLDLVLLENQLPFFILVQLIDMTKFRNAEDNAAYLVHNCLYGLFERFAKVSELRNQVSTQNFDHILGFMHDVSCSSFAALVSQTENENQQVKWEFIKCTTELREAGVQFKKSSDETVSIFDIKFENGVLEIPPLTIGDFSERLFRNLIAYEQHLPNNHQAYVTDYRKFMDCLVNSPKDVEKLRHKGIIVNWMGDDETVSTMFNTLGNQVILRSNYCYSDVFNKLNKHCEKRRNTWLANLRGNYFYNPWSTISFVAATLLLLFTFIQTIFSILSYSKCKC